MASGGRARGCHDIRGSNQLVPLHYKDSRENRKGTDSLSPNQSETPAYGIVSPVLI